ncbi:hypothetical protein VIGAN_01016700 [Vigna angularis var. angularis]|uniref:Uncharacterized protein n=1 Tax=Vigna angularis var. angularis TaxID=157739 RepID=A0A0S3QWQ1_PHAAN|nr:hypothetical protein VIGAN_01016700 [Vigna angularis var. angularis]
MFTFPTSKFIVTSIFFSLQGQIRTTGKGEEESCFPSQPLARDKEKGNEASYCGIPVMTCKHYMLPDHQSMNAVCFYLTEGITLTQNLISKDQFQTLLK